MITFNDLTNIELENTDFEKLINQIDESIKSYHGWWTWEEAIIPNEYSVPVRNEIAKRYKKAGWNFVYHQTSSENGERAGLTCFKFSNEKLENMGKFYEV